MQVLKWTVLLWTSLNIMDFFFRGISDILDALTLITIGYNLAMEDGK